MNDPLRVCLRVFVCVCACVGKRAYPLRGLQNDKAQLDDKTNEKMRKKWTEEGQIGHKKKKKERERERKGKRKRERKSERGRERARLRSEGGDLTEKKEREKRERKEKERNRERGRCKKEDGRHSE